MIQAKACVVTLVLYYLESKQSQIDKPEPGSLLRSRTFPGAFLRKLFIYSLGWSEDTIAG